MPEGLNIAFFGSSLVSAYWNGAATYYRGMIRALHDLGHRVRFFEPDALDRQAHRDLDDPDWAGVTVYPATEADALRALDLASGADVLIKASGVGVFDALLEREVPRRRSENTIAIFWDVDAPATLERVLHDCHDPFRSLIPQYDFILTYGGGDPVANAYKSLGARRCVPVYNALDPMTHYPATQDPSLSCDLRFLGNRLPDREARVEEFFLKTARMLPDRSFLLGGSGWQQHAMPHNVRCLGHVYTHMHNALNCSARAVLNIGRQSMVNYGFSPATRVFEAAGAGACLITDAWEGVEDFLEPGREILVANNAEEVAAHLSSLTPTRARQIGHAARQRILSQHTYAHRARQVTDLLHSQCNRNAEAVTP